MAATHPIRPTSGVVDDGLLAAARRVGDAVRSGDADAVDRAVEHLRRAHGPRRRARSGGRGG